MAAFKNKDNGTWYVQFRYTDWKGERQQKLKRGFATKREALEWEREFLMEKQADVNMTFGSFVALYEKDIKPKLKLNTWLTKESIIKKKILPYFANRKLSEITAKDIIRWQNEIRELRDCHGKPLSKTYLKTVHNQLSAIFNHAARFYGLNINPARQAGNMGTEERKEMLFWTREEYTRFSEAMMDKPLSFYAFEVLYWCGVREGELLALTPADFDFEKRTVTINKSYQRLNKQDVVTTPKTPKSNRVIQMPQFLCDELQDYLKQLYGVEPDSRMFPISKSYVWHTTGAGKTLTSFKTAQILAANPNIKKVIFLVDRKDLDSQTTEEFNKFEAGSVDATDRTDVLVKQMQDKNRQLIVTTMQKMANAVKRPQYAKVMDAYKDEKVVFIIDECHRSQFGDMHKDIVRHFQKAQFFGFTGTPRFEVNGKTEGKITQTTELFHE